MASSDTLVTVTGASGFIGMHCVQDLLASGYAVRGTLRSLDKQAAVREALALDEEQGQRLSFGATKLLEEEGWAQAMEGATYVLHVASPVPMEEPKDEQTIIRPALEGTMRVLEAASAARVSRVVVTSSVAAIMAGHYDYGTRIFTEEDWTNLEGHDLSAYDKSKTMAERAAWDFVPGLEGDAAFEMATINPVFVLGPSLLGLDNASNELIGKLVRREFPGVPRLRCQLVDVRDTARAHRLAMTVPEAAGKRFLLCSDQCWMLDVSRTLKEAGYSVPTWLLPNWMVRITALFDKTVALIVPYLGQEARVSAEQARSVLGWEGRAMKEMVLDTAKDISSRTA